MFTYKKGIWQSDIFKDEAISHGFSTRLGGCSTAPHTASMNTGFYRGDDDGTVIRNINILCKLSGAAEEVVCTPQIHSSIVRCVTEENVGEGTTLPVPFSCDGFVCDRPGITLLVRVADCAPILLHGKRSDGGQVVSAVHAGWKGAVSGIGANAIAEMRQLGAEDIRCAIGPCIHSCCFQVGEDFIESVTAARGADFANRFIAARDNSYYADLPGMNRHILLEAGASHIDILDECTLCKPFLYHSHRATGGFRGTMGAIISINPISRNR